MKTIITLIALLLPCYAMAWEVTSPKFTPEMTQPVARLTPQQMKSFLVDESPFQLRIVRCTGGLAAVQEYVGLDIDCSGVWIEDDQPCKVSEAWRTLPAGCIPLAAAELLYEEELAWRNRPPAPTVIEPVRVIYP